MFHTGQGFMRQVNKLQIYKQYQLGYMYPYSNGLQLTDSTNLARSQ